MGIGKLIGKGISYLGRTFTRTGSRMEQAAARQLGTDAKVTQTTARKFEGPTLSELIAGQPKALPAPTAEQVLASYPRVNTGKVLGKTVDDLNMSQVVTADGVHVRYYRAPGSDKVLMKTEDSGIFHRDTIYDFKGDGNRLVIKQVGDETTYVHTTKNSVQIRKDKNVFKDGISQRVSEDNLYTRFGEEGRIHRSRNYSGNGNYNETIEISNVPTDKDGKRILAFNNPSGRYTVKNEFDHFVDPKDEHVGRLVIPADDVRFETPLTKLMLSDGNEVTDISNALTRNPMLDLDYFLRPFEA